MSSINIVPCCECKVFKVCYFLLQGLPLYINHNHEVDMQKEYTFVAKVLGNGKTTIPREIRDVMKIEEGKYVELTIRQVNV
jgi:hypothetical protein